jgi:5-methylcytosine-specific restriction endonuclease McrA
VRYRIVVSDEAGNTIYQTEEPDQHYTMEEAYRDLDVVSHIRNIVVESVSIQVSASKTREARIGFVDEDYDRKLVKHRYSGLYTHMGNRGDRCTYCDDPFSTELDHVPPLKHVEKFVSLGESAILGLYPSCKRCNTSLGSIPLLDIKSRRRFIQIKLEIENLMRGGRIHNKAPCLFCGKEFSKKRQGHKFCTTKCVDLWHSKCSELTKYKKRDEEEIRLIEPPEEAWEVNLED